MKKANLIDLFVYGTLKVGYWNHDRLCRGVVAVEKAFVCGKLYETSSGIPVLRVPDETILAHGTSDLLADAETQARIQLGAVAEADDRVYGEILTFDDPEDRLAAIDRLEGFRPGLRCTYQRVLLPAFTGHGVVPVWGYIGGDCFEGWELRELAGAWAP